MCGFCGDRLEILAATPISPLAFSTIGPMAASQNTRRVVFALMLVSFALVATFLSLSDAVPAVIRPMKSLTTVLGRVVERILDVNLTKDSIPIKFDQAGHGVIWGGGMLIVGYGLRRRVWLPLLAAVMIVVSLGFEVLQGAVTATRTVSMDDGWGNIGGILIATLIIALTGPLVDWWIRRAETEAVGV